MNKLYYISLDSTTMEYGRNIYAKKFISFEKAFEYGKRLAISEYVRKKQYRHLKLDSLFPAFTMKVINTESSNDPEYLDAEIRKYLLSNTSAKEILITNNVFRIEVLHFLYTGQYIYGYSLYAYNECTCLNDVLNSFELLNYRVKKYNTGDLVEYYIPTSHKNEIIEIKYGLIGWASSIFDTSKSNLLNDRNYTYVIYNLELEEFNIWATDEPISESMIIRKMDDKEFPDLVDKISSFREAVLKEYA